MSFKTWLRGWLFKNHDLPAVTTSQELAEFLLKGNLNKSISGEAVTPNNAMTVAAVYAAVNVLSESLAMLPFQVFENVETDFGQGKEKATDYFLYDLLTRKPNQWQTPFEFIQMLMLQMLMRGNGIAIKVMGRGKQISELIPVEADRVTVKQNERMNLEYTITRREGGKPLVFTQKAVLHIRGLTLDGITGVSPLKWWRETIGSAMALQRHGASLFGNAASPSGVLQHPKRLLKEARDNLQDSIEGMTTGDRLNSLLILEEGMEFKQTTMTQEDAQFIETKNFSRSEIAAIFRVPPHMIGDLTRATFSNIESQDRNFATNSLQPWATRWEQAVLRDLIPKSDQKKYFARFILKALMRGDTKTRGEFYVKMVSNGLMSPNEIRELEEMNPREGGDEFMKPLNMGSNEDESDQSESETESEESTTGGENNTF